MLQETRDDGDLHHTILTNTLQLKKEIGNARIVSGDAMLWVGEAKLTQKDVDVAGKSAKEFRLEKGKRSFAFTLETTTASKQFVDELKEQIDGKLGLEVKRKKRKIRKQMSQAMGFVPVNMLKSPVAKPPATPTKLPTSASKSPRLAKPLEVSVATVPDAYQPYPSPSPSKSPFRSPFRKKPAPRQSNLPLSPSLTDPRLTSSPRVREWLSPVGSMKTKVELTPPENRRQSLGTPSSGGSTDGKQGSPSVRIANKRVRSLQGLLDDVPKDTQPPPPPPPPAQLLTPPKQKVQLTPPKQHIVSHYFAKKAMQNESPSLTETKTVKFELSPAKLSSPSQAKQDESQGDSTSRESTQEGESSDQVVTTTGFPRRNIRGLLNLGNYCYMNSIVQAVTKLPDFIAGVQNEEWLYKVIRKKLGHDTNSANSKTLEEVKAIVDDWKDRDEHKTLVLHSALEDVIKKIMTGCDSPINPEPLKQVMGKKNSIFATYVTRYASLHTDMDSLLTTLLFLMCRHFQQDAHEFLLNLVNEYEKELLSAVKSAVEKAKEEGEAQQQSPAAPKRSSLLNFFRSEPKAEGETKDAKQKVAAAAEEDDLVGELLPAQCFRAELYRTLTCSACEYSRKQVEQFYDFSLDLPFNPVVRPTDEEAAAAAAKEKPSKKQCFCELDAAVRNTITERIYHCAKAACSYQEKVPTEIVPEPLPSSEQQDPESTTAVAGPSGFPSASTQPPRPTIHLDSLMRKQFEPETLELSCEKCKSGKEAVAAYAVKSLPPVIVLHLKRFEVDFKTGKLYKRCDLVEAPASLKPTHTIVGEAESEDDQSYELVVSAAVLLNAVFITMISGDHLTLPTLY